MKKGRSEEALYPLQEAVRLDPSLSDAFYNLAVAAARMGDREDAVRWLHQALERDPSLASVARNEKAFQDLPFE